jgi:excinuclease ABC subunit C
VDISNTQGTNAVGSVVVFEDDQPAKSGYRRFRIRGVQGPNDFAMIEEVLARRLRGLVEREQPLPDLVLVDGGKGQLAAAVRAYQGLGTRSESSDDSVMSRAKDIPILGLAKRTDTLFYVDGREISLPVRSGALKLLKRIRDESHRFAISYHRRLRGKRQLESELDLIRGLGPARKKALLQHFGSIERLRLAAVADITKVRGIGPALAETVARRLRG